MKQHFDGAVNAHFDLSVSELYCVQTLQKGSTEGIFFNRGSTQKDREAGYFTNLWQPNKLSPLQAFSIGHVMGFSDRPLPLDWKYQTRIDYKCYTDSLMVSIRTCPECRRRQVGELCLCKEAETQHVELAMAKQGGIRLEIPVINCGTVFEAVISGTPLLCDTQVGIVWRGVIKRGIQ